MAASTRTHMLIRSSMEKLWLQNLKSKMDTTNEKNNSNRGYVALTRNVKSRGGDSHSLHKTSKGMYHGKRRKDSLGTFQECRCPLS